MDKADLDALKKGDARKLLVGGWLHAHYPLTRKWIASRLALGHPSRVGVAMAAYRFHWEEDGDRKVELEMEQSVRVFG